MVIGLSKDNLLANDVKYLKSACDQLISKISIINNHQLWWGSLSIRVIAKAKTIYYDKKRDENPIFYDRTELTKHNLTVRTHYIDFENDNDDLISTKNTDNLKNNIIAVLPIICNDASLKFIQTAIQAIEPVFNKIYGQITIKQHKLYNNTNLVVIAYTSMDRPMMYTITYKPSDSDVQDHYNMHNINILLNQFDPKDPLHINPDWVKGQAINATDPQSFKTQVANVTANINRLLDDINVISQAFLKAEKKAYFNLLYLTDHATEENSYRRPFVNTYHSPFTTNDACDNKQSAFRTKFAMDHDKAIPILFEGHLYPLEWLCNDFLNLKAYPELATTLKDSYQNDPEFKKYIDKIM